MENDSSSDSEYHNLEVNMIVSFEFKANHFRKQSHDE